MGMGWAIAQTGKALRTGLGKARGGDRDGTRGVICYASRL